MNTYWTVTDEKISRWAESLPHDFKFKPKNRIYGAMCKQAQLEVLYEILSMLPEKSTAKQDYALWRNIMNAMIKQIEASK